MLLTSRQFRSCIWVHLSLGYFLINGLVLLHRSLTIDLSLVDRNNVTTKPILNDGSAVQALLAIGLCVFSLSQEQSEPFTTLLAYRSQFTNSCSTVIKSIFGIDS